MKQLDVIELTSSIPWDPCELDEDDALTEDAIMIAKANPTRTEPAPHNLEEIRPYLGWKYTDIIEKTLKATKQYGKITCNCPCSNILKHNSLLFYVAVCTKPLQPIRSFHCNWRMMVCI